MLGTTGFALRVISSVCLPLYSGATGLHCFQESLPALSVRWGRRTLHSRWDCDSAPCLGMGKPGSGAGRTPCLIIQIRHMCATPSSLIRVYPLIWYCRGAKPLGRITTWALWVWTQSAKIHMLVVASPFSLTVRFPVFEPCRFPYDPCSARSDRVGVPRKQPTMPGKLTNFPGSLFSLKEWKTRGRSFCHVVLAWGGDSAFLEPFPLPF